MTCNMPAKSTVGQTLVLPIWNFPRGIATAQCNRLQLFHVLSIHQYKVHQYTEQFVPTSVSSRVEQITIFSDFTRENRATSGHMQQERQVFTEQQNDRQVQGQQHCSPGENRQG